MPAPEWESQNAMAGTTLGQTAPVPNLDQHGPDAAAQCPEFGRCFVPHGQCHADATPLFRIPNVLSHAQTTPLAPGPRQRNNLPFASGNLSWIDHSRPHVRPTVRSHGEVAPARFSSCDRANPATSSAAGLVLANWSKRTWQRQISGTKQSLQLLAVHTHSGEFCS